MVDFLLHKSLLSPRLRLFSSLFRLRARRDSSSSSRKWEWKEEREVEEWESDGDDRPLIDKSPSFSPRCSSLDLARRRTFPPTTPLGFFLSSFSSSFYSAFNVRSFGGQGASPLPLPLLFSPKMALFPSLFLFRFPPYRSH